MMSERVLSETQGEFVQRQRLAYLTTANADESPLAIPICFNEVRCKDEARR